VEEFWTKQLLCSIQIQYLREIAHFTKSRSIGPLITIIFFSIGGGTWDLCTLKNIIFVGMAVEVCMGCLMFFFRDDKVLEEESSSSSSNSNDCGRITIKDSVLSKNPE